MNLRGLIQPVFSYSVIPRRWSRRRVVPPEFLKRYIPKIDTKSLEKLHEKYNAISSSTLLDPKLVRQDQDIPRLYPELLPHNLDPRYRDRLRERLERREMMLRRRNLHIPEFYVGSILAVTVADRFAPDGAHRFVGLCIERYNEGLWTTLTLRNVIEKTAVEISYELYNPTIQAIDVLLLEKRLDQNLLYLRDAPLQESRVPFDMTPVPHPPNTPVPINTKKVKLLPPPWKFKWFLHGYRGIDDSMFDYLSPKQLDEMKTKLTLVDRYDLMKMYRSRPCVEDKQIAFGHVHLQHQDLIRYHEQRRQQLIERYQASKTPSKAPVRGTG
ncbi:Large subunit ribosomal protein L19 [Paragonimus heterotremus]|uniref:Large ribosomal subunit protein bL19m n=1 Tax=Paragonimus heterotremus TaxID=100268 RepID=A0A8J4WI52_9TREM|nr:Large subunit ribosomal protein L19 [Paragonimus heterotremus]